MEREMEKKLMDHFFKSVFFPPPTDLIYLNVHLLECDLIREDDETLSERIDESQKQLIEKDISFYALEAERPKGNLDISLIDSDPFKPIHNILKGLSYILCFLVLLTGGVISKGTLFFMTSQIHPGTKHGYCSQSNIIDKINLHSETRGFFKTKPNKTKLFVSSFRTESGGDVEPKRANFVDLGHFLLLPGSGVYDAVPLHPHLSLPRGVLSRKRVHFSGPVRNAAYHRHRLARLLRPAQH